MNTDTTTTADAASATGGTVGTTLAHWTAQLVRPAARGVDPPWSLFLSHGATTKCLPVMVERIAKWDGPCSNEVAYRCLVPREDAFDSAIEGGLTEVAIERRGLFQIEAIAGLGDGATQLTLHRRT